MQKNLFKKSSVDQISSPEQLNDYIKVSNPAVWMILAAIVILLASALVWGFFGSMATTVSLKGIAQSGKILCFVDPSTGVVYEEGMEAAVTTNTGVPVTGEIVSVSQNPLSYNEAAAGINSDYAVYALSLSDWNVQFVIEIDSALTDGAVYSVSVTTKSIRPISLILG